eukprot:8212721-Pyramimonas_sp.AAC.1
MLEPLNDSVLQQAVTDIVNHFLQNPGRILYAKVKVFSDEMVPRAAPQEPMDVDEGEGQEPPPFSDQYHYLSSTPKDFIRMYLKDTVPGTFTEEVVTQIEKADKNRKPGSSSLRELLYMGHGMKPGTKWPQHGKRRP